MGAEEADAAEEQPGLEVLLGLPGRPIARRSESHMSQCLEASRGVLFGGWGLPALGLPALLCSETHTN